jgi:hypothetical protein
MPFLSQARSPSLCAGPYVAELPGSEQLALALLHRRPCGPRLWRCDRRSRSRSRSRSHCLRKRGGGRGVSFSGSWRRRLRRFCRCCGGRGASGGGGSGRNTCASATSASSHRVHVRGLRRAAADDGHQPVRPPLLVRCGRASVRRRCLPHLPWAGYERPCHLRRVTNLWTPHRIARTVGRSGYRWVSACASG